MKFISLTIIHGLYQDKYDFKEGINIVYSKKNSVGKTTLLRFLFYSLGYQIPSIRGINFDTCECILELKNEQNNICIIQRQKSIISITIDNDIFTYALPDDLNELQSKIFNNSNVNILNNILGSCYVDQEKGWTLLNRGKAIGKIPFSIERLICGLSDRSFSDLEIELTNVKRELNKYKYMFNVSQYQKDINIRNENIAFNTSSEELERNIDILYSERKPISDEFERIKNVIRKNTEFIKYITDFQLKVKKGNVIIPVNEETIVDFQDNVEYLIAKKQIFANQLAVIDKKIYKIKERQSNENNLLNVETVIQEFDEDISRLKVDAIKIEKIIKQLENKKNNLDDAIKKKVKENNSIVDELYQLIVNYTSELNIEDMYIRSHPEYIFTKDLKSLSGAIFHKIVFSFKLSYIKLIYTHTGIKLPIVLDSPRGREVDTININDMMKILVRDFSEHQIIIASIFRYDFNNPNYIEIKDKLFKYEKKEEENTAQIKQTNKKEKT